MWFYRNLGKASKAVKKAEEMLKRAQEKSAKNERIKDCEQQLQQAQEESFRVEEGRNRYRQTQQGVSLALHPFRVEDKAVQTQEDIKNSLLKKVEEFKEIGISYDIEGTVDVTEKCTKQIDSVTDTVGAWWLWVMESVESMKLKEEEEEKQWALSILLPVVYWYQQIQRTHNPDLRKAYRGAYEKGYAFWQIHLLTQKMKKWQIQHCQEWAEWICAKFRRSSSSIEGRNGCLVQMYHNGRGVGARCLKALTVIHNFDTRRENGTTPAERLFETKFSNLFERLIDEIKELPIPRQARLGSCRDSLKLQTVAA
jgi:hypothetical protein